MPEAPGPLGPAVSLDDVLPIDDDEDAFQSLPPSRSSESVAAADRCPRCGFTSWWRHRPLLGDGLVCVYCTPGADLPIALDRQRAVRIIDSNPWADPRMWCEPMRTAVAAERARRGRDADHPALAALARAEEVEAAELHGSSTEIATASDGAEYVVMLGLVRIACPTCGRTGTVLACSPSAVAPPPCPRCTLLGDQGPREP